MAVITVPDTAADQSVAATAIGDDATISRKVLVKVVDPTTVYLLRQDTGNAPTCTTVIAEGYPLIGNAVTPELGESAELFDPNGKLKLANVFAACSSGSSELRIL